MSRHKNYNSNPVHLSGLQRRETKTSQLESYKYQCCSYVSIKQVLQTCFEYHGFEISMFGLQSDCQNKPTSIVMRRVQQVVAFEMQQWFVTPLIFIHLVHLFYEEMLHAIYYKESLTQTQIPNLMKFGQAVQESPPARPVNDDNIAS